MCPPHSHARTIQPRNSASCRGQRGALSDAPITPTDVAVAVGLTVTVPVAVDLAVTVAVAVDLTEGTLSANAYENV